MYDCTIAYPSVMAFPVESRVIWGMNKIHSTWRNIQLFNKHINTVQNTVWKQL